MIAREKNRPVHREGRIVSRRKIYVRREAWKGEEKTKNEGGGGGGGGETGGGKRGGWHGGGR